MTCGSLAVNLLALAHPIDQVPCTKFCLTNHVIYGLFRIWPYGPAGDDSILPREEVLRLVDGFPGSVSISLSRYGGNCSKDDLDHKCCIFDSIRRETNRFRCCVRNFTVRRRFFSVIHLSGSRALLPAGIHRSRITTFNLHAFARGGSNLFSKI